MHLCTRVFAAVILVPALLVALVSCGSGGSDSGGGSGAFASAAPGGFVERAGSEVRSRWTSDQLQSFLPESRGPFMFPAPYNTKGVRLTDASDCTGGGDCVWNVGYSYWRNMNNHVGSDEMLIFLSLSQDSGGAGPTLFMYNKVNDVVSKVGPLFPAGSKFANNPAATWYFSASLPTTIYIDDGPRMLRYDVITKQFETVFDITAQFGADRQVAQMYSSNDDQVHSATLRVASTGEDLGCMVYFEGSQQFRFYAKVGQFDECQVDKSGHQLMIFEQIDGLYGVDNRFIDLDSGAEERLMQLPGIGAVGHHDSGYGYVVGHDSFNSLANATITWSLTPSPAKGPVVNRDYAWDIVQAQHISHTNAKPGVPKEQQYACGSNADRANYAQNEIVCFMLDGSLEQLIVAPVMTNLDASGGRDDYSKAPKGNLDVTGQYFIWTTNLGGNRLDAFVVKVPGQLLSRG